MTHKDDALQEIVSLAQHNNITLDEIAKVMANVQAQTAKVSSGVVPKLLSYIGGIFVFAGVSVFISMYWHDFGSAVRVIATLGIGFIAFIMSVVSLADEKYERAATPLFLISMLLQPAGIFVMLDEYSSGGDPRHGVLYMATFMLIQQGTIFWAKQRTTLAFGTILFACIFFVTLFDIWHMDGELIGTVIGTSLMCIAYALNQSRHAAICPFWYFIGSGVLLWSVFDAVESTPFELIFLGLAGFMIFLSTYVRSRTLLLVSTLSMLGYIGYYTAEHFANTVGWPIALVIIGMALIGLSSLAIKLNNKYIRQPI